jgi:single-stranded DNA-binding protein
MSSTKHERRSNMSATQRTLTVKLDANLGSDPELCTIREELRTLCLAVNTRDAETQPLIRWHRRIDWQGLTAAYRKGDRLCLSGFIRLRKYQQYGDETQLPEIVFTDARLQRIKTHVEAPIDEAVELQFHKLPHQSRTLSLAVTTRDDEVQPLTRWRRRVDWQGLTAAYQKGDRVWLGGFFRVRRYQQDGEERQLPEIVFTGPHLERIRLREQVA